MQAKSPAGEYPLATGEAAVRRLTALHRVYSPAGRRVLQRAGLKPGMTVADLGCGVGATTCMLAEMVGLTGHVTGIDLSASQLEQGRSLCKAQEITNAVFMEASATATGLPRNSFDLVYCRFLLLHLVDPAAGLREMFAILKPGGVLVVEDCDLTSAGSIPASSLDSVADLFGRLGPTRGLNYSLGSHLYHLVKKAGCPEPDIEIHQPAMARGEERFLLKWSMEEPGRLLSPLDWSLMLKWKRSWLIWTVTLRTRISWCSDPGRLWCGHGSRIDILAGAFLFVWISDIRRIQRVNTPELV